MLSARRQSRVHVQDPVPGCVREPGVLLRLDEHLDVVYPAHLRSPALEVMSNPLLTSPTTQLSRNHIAVAVSADSVLSPKSSLPFPDLSHRFTLKLVQRDKLRARRTRGHVVNCRERVV